MQVGCPWGWNIGITINYDESMLTWMSDHSHTTSALLFHAGILVKRQQKICVGSYPFFSPLSQEFLRYQWETSQVKSMLGYPTIVSSVSHRWQQSAEFDSTSTGGTEKEAFLGPLLRGVWLARTLGSTLLRPQRRSSQCYFLSVHSFINSYIHWSL